MNRMDPLTQINDNYRKAISNNEGTSYPTAFCFNTPIMSVCASAIFEHRAKKAFARYKVTNKTHTNALNRPYVYV